MLAIKRNVVIQTTMSFPKPIAWTKQGDCMACVSHRPGPGYPRICRHGKTESIARRILLRRFGAIAPKLVARHTCDNRICINPRHILLGTYSDNNRDTWQRSSVSRAASLANLFYRQTKPWAKLEEGQVLEIRALLKTSMKRREIQRRFGINRNSLYKIASGQSWKHLSTPGSKFLTSTIEMAG